MKIEVKAILIAGLLLRAVLITCTPLIETPSVIPYYNDEAAHLNYVRYLANHNQLPVQTQSIKDGIEKAGFEYYQAPLYYLLVRPFFDLGRSLTPGHELLWIRILSLLFTMAGALIFYRSILRFIPDASIAALSLLLALISGIPTRFGSIVTNDSLLFLLSCFFFALILQILTDGCDWKLLTAGVVIVIAGLWTKASFIVTLPVLPIVLLMESPKAYLKALLVLLIPMVAILPWYLRNYDLYGMILPLSIGFGQPDPIGSANLLWRIIHTGIYFGRTFLFPFDELWGGPFDTVIWVLEGLALLAFISWGMIALLKHDLKLFQVSIMVIGLNLISYLLLNRTYFQAEARLFLPALPFIYLALALGVDRLAGKRKNLTIAILGLWILLPWMEVFN